MKTDSHARLYHATDMTALAAILTIAIIAVGILLVTRYTADEPLGQYATAHHDIRAALDEYNDGLPAESDGVIYEKTAIEDNNIVYRYTLLDEEILETLLFRLWRPPRIWLLQVWHCVRAAATCSSIPTATAIRP